MGSYILLSVSPFMIFYNLQALVLELYVFVSFQSIYYREHNVHLFQ